MDEDQDIKYNLEDSEGIWDTGACLSFIKELEHSLYFRNSVEPHNNIAWNLVMTLAWEQEVKEISRKNAEQVLFEPVRFPISRSQQFRVLDHYSLVKITLVGSHKHVHNIEEVAGVVQDDPAEGESVLELPEAGSPNDEDQIVHDGKVDDDQPFVVIILAGVKCEIAPDSSFEVGRGFVISYNVERMVALIM